MVERDSVSAIVECLTDPDGLGAIAGRTLCILPPGAQASGVTQTPKWQFGQAEEATAFSSYALSAAASAQRPLLVIRGPIRVDNEPVSALLDALGADPMFGFAVARVATGTGELAPLHEDLGDPEIKWLPRAALAVLPAYYIVPEVLGSCFVVRREVVANFGGLESRFETIAGAWLHYLCRARRAGFRGVIVNRAVVASADRTPAATSFPLPADYWEIHHQYPDIQYARQEFCRLPPHEYESLVARAFSRDERERKTLLMDARGMEPLHNGTSVGTLGLLDGFSSIASGWQISVLVKPEAQAFHRLAERYPYWTVCDRLPERRFSLSLRLSQPWDVQTLIELHGRALFNFFLMLDTISWDVMYNGTDPVGLDCAWRFLADHADGIMYNSEFSRQRFLSRFPPYPGVRHYVSYLSFHQDEYRRPFESQGDGEYLLVIGNQLDHKWVSETVSLLATAFPFHSVHAIGCGNLRLSNVKSVRSGQLSDAEINDMFAAARIIVFPSFYEGFGLPILQGLSYGKPVVARASSLLEEVAARCRADGRLYAYSSPLELMEIVARLLHGEEIGHLTLGSALPENGEPMRWRDVARNMLDFMDAALRAPGSCQWWRRMQSVQMLQGWRS